MVEKIGDLPNNHPDKRTLIQQFQAQVCEKKKQHVWCCKDGKPMSESSKIFYYI